MATINVATISGYTVIVASFEWVPLDEDYVADLNNQARSSIISYRILPWYHGVSTFIYNNTLCFDNNSCPDLILSI